jgi:hypothetical protein
MSLFTFMNNKNVSGSGPQVWSVGVWFEELEKATPTQYRMGIRDGHFQHMWWWHDAGWHFSYMMTKEQIIDKVQNFAHQEFNNPSVLSKIDPIKKARAGQDILGREHCTWSLVKMELLDLPAYVKSHMHTYGKYFLEPLE